MRRFGVEFEVGGEFTLEGAADIVRNVTKRAVMTNEASVKTRNNDYWHVKLDSSCGILSSGGLEIASFIGQSQDDIKEIAHMARAMFEAGLRANQKCGFHVHIEVADFSPDEVGVLAARWCKLEEIMQNTVPPWRKTCDYCRPFAKNHNINFNKVYSSKEFWDLVAPADFSDIANNDRRLTLNLVNFARDHFYDRTDRRTVEFRFPEGTLYEGDVENWIRLFQKIVDHAQKAKMPQNLKPLPKPNFFKMLALTEEESILKNWLNNRLNRFGDTK